MLENTKIAMSLITLPNKSLAFSSGLKSGCLYSLMGVGTVTI
jgi:hypothetical protein